MAAAPCGLGEPDPPVPVIGSFTDPLATGDIIFQVSKTSVEVNRDIASQAADILGTTTLRDTIDAALREIVNARRRLELMAMLSEPGRFDFDAAENAWGGDG